MKKKLVILLALTIGLTLVLSGCFPSSIMDETVNPAGFFWGLWHGLIAPISLIASIFNSDVSLYEVNNVGFWYNLGFYLVIAGEGFGIKFCTRSNRQQ